jgi:hypothetical protein
MMMVARRQTPDSEHHRLCRFTHGRHPRADRIIGAYNQWLLEWRLQRPAVAPGAHRREGQA